MKKVGLIPKLLIGIVLGIFVGLYASENVISVVQTIKDVLGSIIFFTIPLVIIGFVTPAISGLRKNASQMLGTYLGLSYSSAVGASLFSAAAAYFIVPMLNISSKAETLKEIPKLGFKLSIDPIMPVMSALVLAIMLGVAIIWTKSEKMDALFGEFQNMILSIVSKIIIPILPVYIFTTFSGLAYEGLLTKQLPIFFKMIIIVIIGHFIWLTLLYSIAALVSKKNPFEVIKHYPPVYITAMGTMSSAATLPVALTQAKKSRVLPDEVVNFAIPLGATTHLSGSVLTETFFCMTIAQMLYGQMPSFGTILLFSMLFGIFAVGAPGVPGGTVMASLAIVTSVLGFDADGVGLLIAIFAIQDSFGTACNVTGDGALALILRGLFYKDVADKPAEQAA
ncbi:MAG: dicarboxylate/amino acid:cation symporter [Firmicutes bacterium]|jgi:Na+/H+-dicarboxylate symporter|nr:dicarboxylate/amino acid:cation symporter [Bacillota bacterium]